MKITHVIFVMTLIFLSSGCSAGMTGTVVDDETGKPIEGAVVLVEWTKTSGKWLGMPSTESFHVIEKVTDKEGRFSVPKVGGISVNPPDITIYKKGYVAWNSRITFPDFRARTDFKWGDIVSIKLEVFNDNKYNHNDHILFIHSAIKLGLGEKKLIIDAIDWEEKKAFSERKKNWSK
jgi:hypothetical protein